MKVLVTGASGYVGRAVLRDLEAAGHGIVAAVRDPARLPPRWRDRAAAVGEISADTDWSAALSGVDAVVHLASPSAPGGLADDILDRIVVAGTKRLAEAAQRAGARRFVFMSSVKAVGETTPFAGVDETVDPAPEDSYGRAKIAAERALQDTALSYPGLEVAILRPPPVYGPGSGGNVRRIIDFLRGAPPVLPLGILGNRRSFLHRDNLASATLACLEKPEAAGRTFFVTDGEPLSTGALVRRILTALDRRALLLPLPAAGLSRLGATGRRLGASCVFDDTALRRTLDWKPVVDGRAGMLEAVRFAADPLQTAVRGDQPC
ncbi:NAD-dependent epimerase/dehydratase family protein [Thalassobaculum sp. OXR-137]|uniref:NAD-dependent epimerase/dehydratase family protein n=1 Tax=Thalassobaculum sp. OXR-137 TaxID=3100173 RepID=UPI002AC9C84A|nr:NAD-dependent epimerase/dehydratase family protein [Thalassobaculum sp. OXR-137]WPZ35337.1 NAD-dependent epimerase/dehydratase family protein [Thalassobaculum sp. OXR-137]